MNSFPRPSGLTLAMAVPPVLETVPDPPWFMVTKADAAEIFAAWPTGPFFILAMILLVIAAAAGGLMLWHRRAKVYYRAMFLAEAARRQIEQRYHVALMSVGDGIIVSDVEAHVEFLNSVAEALTGWTNEEARGKPVEEVFRIVNEQTRRTVENPVHRVLREGVVVGLANHTLLIARDGTERPIADSGAPIRHENGGITGAVFVFRDQTEERKLQETLRKEKDYTESIIRSMADMLVVVSPDGTIATVNEASCQSLGYSKDELIGQPVTLLFEEEEEEDEDKNGEEDTLQSMLSQYPLPLKRTVLRRLVEEGSVSNIERSLLTKSGDRIPVLLSGAVMRDENDAMRGIVCLALDITERERAKQALERLNAELEQRVLQRTAELAESEERYRRLFQESADMVFVHEIGPEGPGRILEVNDVAVESLGYSRQELLRMSPLDLETPESRQEPPRLVERLQRGETVMFERVAAARDGRRIPLEIHGKAFRWQGALRVLFQARDITNRKQAEEALRIKDWAVRSSINGIAISDLDGNLTYVNPAFLDLWGYSDQSEVLGRSTSEFWQARKDAEAVIEALRREGSWKGEMVAKKRDGSLIDVEVASSMVFNDAGTPLCMMAAFSDITDRKRSQEAIRRSEKMRIEAEKLAATGQIAAQIAHEINNPLAGIKNSFRLIKDAVPADHPDHDMVRRIDREIDRIAHVVRQMYKLNSPRAKTPTDIPVGETIHDVLLMLEPLGREHEVTIEFAPLSEELVVRAPEGSLQQVLYNLTVNAIQASPRSGVVNIDAQPTDNNYVRISIRDQGPGIRAEVQHRVFEPFFSVDVGNGSKEGIGLGLSIVKSIVESAGGRIEFESKLGEGTSFHAYFPSRLP